MMKRHELMIAATEPTRICNERRVNHFAACSHPLRSKCRVILSTNTILNLVVICDWKVWRLQVGQQLSKRKKFERKACEAFCDCLI